MRICSRAALSIVLIFLILAAGVSLHADSSSSKATAPPAPAAAEPSGSGNDFMDEAPYITNAQKARTLAKNVCSVCHGVMGISQWPFVPNLAGMDKTYLTDQLKGLRARARTDHYAQMEMWGIAANLDNGVIEALADYFSKLPAPSGYHADRFADLVLGRKIFENGLDDRKVPGCQTCHVYGLGDVNVPRVGGQHADYTARSLREFRAGFRVNENMNFISGKLTDAEINAVAAYLSTIDSASAEAAAKKQQPAGDEAAPAPAPAE